MYFDVNKLSTAIENGATKYLEDVIPNKGVFFTATHGAKGQERARSVLNCIRGIKSKEDKREAKYGNHRLVLLQAIFHKESGRGLMGYILQSLISTEVFTEKAKEKLKEEGFHLDKKSSNIITRDSSSPSMRIRKAFERSSSQSEVKKNQDHIRLSTKGIKFGMSLRDNLVEMIKEQVTINTGEMYANNEIRPEPTAQSSHQLPEPPTYNLYIESVPKDQNDYAEFRFRLIDNQIKISEETLAENQDIARFMRPIWDLDYWDFQTFAVLWVKNNHPGAVSGTGLALTAASIVGAVVLRNPALGHDLTGIGGRRAKTIDQIMEEAGISYGLDKLDPTSEDFRSNLYEHALSVQKSREEAFKNAQAEAYKNAQLAMEKMRLGQIPENTVDGSNVTSNDNGEGDKVSVPQEHESDFYKACYSRLFQQNMAAQMMHEDILKNAQLATQQPIFNQKPENGAAGPNVAGTVNGGEGNKATIAKEESQFHSDKSQSSTMLFSHNSANSLVSSQGYDFDMPSSGDYSPP